MKLVWLVVPIIFLTGFSSVETPAGLQLTPENKLHLAQVVVGEADWRKADHIAIAWVLAKRWVMFQRSEKYDPATQDFSWFIMNYSSTMKISKERARRIRQLPWADPARPHSDNVNLDRYTRNWAKVRDTVTQWSNGQYPDPCPKALHWGGTMDNPDKIRRPGVVWEPVSCGPTRNIYYRPITLKNKTGG